MKKTTVTILFLCLWIMSAGQITKIVEFGDTAYAYTDADFELLQAATEGDTNRILAFLGLGTDVNTPTWDGVTPLMFAAQGGHLRAVEILIDSGANVNQKPYSHIDALLGATIAGHVLVVDTLILNGANISTKNLDGITPLMYAAAFDHYLICDVLLFYGADVNKSDDFLNTALHFSAFYGNLEVTQLLVEKGANLNSADNLGFTPLMCASQNGHWPVVDYLIQAGCDINLTNFSNLDALSLAIASRYYGIVDLLIQSGADVNRQIYSNVNQYELARENSGREMTMLLKSYGAQPINIISLSKLITSFDMNMNNRDLMIGGSFTLVESVYDLQAELGYMTRPAVRSIRYDIDDQSQYQFWEKRSVVNLGLGKRFEFASPRPKEVIGAYVSANAGYTYGSFRGSEKKPDDRIVFIPKAGLFYKLKALHLKIEYEYFKIKGSDFPPHRITLSVGAIFNLLKSDFKLKKEPRL